MNISEKKNKRLEAMAQKRLINTPCNCRKGSLDITTKTPNSPNGFFTKAFDCDDSTNVGLSVGQTVAFFLKQKSCSSKMNIRMKVIERLEVKPQDDDTSFDKMSKMTIESKDGADPDKQKYNESFDYLDCSQNSADGDSEDEQFENDIVTCQFVNVRNRREKWRKKSHNNIIKPIGETYYGVDDFEGGNISWS